MHRTSSGDSHGSAPSLERGGASAASLREEGAKRRAEQASIPQYPASRIVLLRRVSWEATLGLLQDLGARFGTVERVIMLRSKNHALIEFTRLEDAVRMVEHYTTHHNALIDIGTHPATVGFCKHQKWVAPEATKTLLASLFDSSHRITECIYVSARLIYQLFAPYGAVEAVIVLPKKSAKNRVQALVQFANTAQATVVKEKMQGLPVWFDESAQLALDLLYSKVESISYALLPGSTLLVPSEVVNRHVALIEKYGSLVDAFSKKVSDMTLDELEDFSAWRDLLRRVASEQLAVLLPKVRALTYLSEEQLDSGDEFSKILTHLHRPIAEEWYTLNDITPEKQQQALRNMENLIHNGGMAATCRVVCGEEDSGDDAPPEVAAIERNTDVGCGVVGASGNQSNSGHQYLSDVSNPTEKLEAIRLLAESIPGGISHITGIIGNGSRGATPTDRVFDGQETDQDSFEADFMGVCSAPAVLSRGNMNIHAVFNNSGIGIGPHSLLQYKVAKSLATGGMVRHFFADFSFNFTSQGMPMTPSSFKDGEALLPTSDLGGSDGDELMVCTKKHFFFNFLLTLKYFQFWELKVCESNFLHGLLRECDKCREDVFIPGSNTPNYPTISI